MFVNERKVEKYFMQKIKFSLKIKKEKKIFVCEKHKRTIMLAILGVFCIACLTHNIQKR